LQLLLTEKSQIADNSATTETREKKNKPHIWNGVPPSQICKQSGVTNLSLYKHWLGHNVPVLRTRAGAFITKKL